MALELMAASKKSKGINVYDTSFDNARNAARNPKKTTSWKIATTVLPMGSEWEFGTDDKGPYARRTEFRYSLCRRANHLLFIFQYWLFLFIIPLADKGDFESEIKLLNKSNPKMEPLTIKIVKLTTSPHPQSRNRRLTIQDLDHTG